MNELTVRHVVGDRFDIAIRDHAISVDQPVSDGGDDTASTPTELFVASLASCVAFYARRYLARHQLSDEGLRVTARYSMGNRPARVAEIQLEIALPDDVPDDRREALLAVAGHCTVHNTLTTPPSVELTLRGTSPMETA